MSHYPFQDYTTNALLTLGARFDCKGKFIHTDKHRCALSCDYQEQERILASVQVPAIGSHKKGKLGQTATFIVAVNSWYIIDVIQQLKARPISPATMLALQPVFSTAEYYHAVRLALPHLCTNKKEGPVADAIHKLKAQLLAYDKRQCTVAPAITRITADDIAIQNISARHMEPFNIVRSTSGSTRHEAQSRKQRRAVQVKQLRMKLHID